MVLPCLHHPYCAQLQLNYNGIAPGNANFNCWFTVALPVGNFLLSISLQSLCTNYPALTAKSLHNMNSVCNRQHVDERK